LNREELKRLNPQLNINEVTDCNFKAYGNVLYGLDLASLISFADNHLDIPAEGVIYEPSLQVLEEYEVCQLIQEEVYGEMPIEVGYCAGHNTSLTGVEYHNGSETIIAVTDCVLILGKRQDIEQYTYDGGLAEYFYLPRGMAVELYSTTLHYAPCKVSEKGFMILVILPQGTNLPLDSHSNRNPLLMKKNKFVLVHQTQAAQADRGFHPGLKGQLISLHLNEV